MNSTYWPAPAKLNRFLHINGRRADGYHELQTAFQFLDYADELSFEACPRGDIRRAQPLPDVTEADDLCLRAAKLLRTTVAASGRNGSRLGAIIHLHKRLPLGGGLGGGSSDAATVLVALNQLWQTGLSVDQLAALGLSLGADVPVFVRGVAAWGEGVGDRLTPLALDEPWFLVIVPPVQVATAAVFGDPALTRDSERLTMRADLQALGNDCEAVVYRRYPAVAAAARWLNQFVTARLTGTGACLFAPFATCEQAQAVLERRPEGVTGFVAKGVNHSRLQERLQSARIRQEFWYD